MRFVDLTFSFLMCVYVIFQVEIPQNQKRIQIIIQKNSNQYWEIKDLFKLLKHGLNMREIH